MAKAKTKSQLPYARGWQFTREDQPDKPICFMPESEYATADEAVRDYSRHASFHFSLYFRTRDGKLHSTSDTSVPEDFSEGHEICPEYLEYLMQVAHDTKKEFTYSKDQGAWFWHDRNEPCDLDGESFASFFAALQDATEPYLIAEGNN